MCRAGSTLALLMLAAMSDAKAVADEWSGIRFGIYAGADLRTDSFHDRVLEPTYGYPVFQAKGDHERSTVSAAGLSLGLDKQLSSMLVERAYHTTRFQMT